MGWLKMVAPPHFCDLPYKVPQTVGVGSVWECDCGKQYEYTGTGRDYFGDPYPKWKELTP